MALRDTRGRFARGGGGSAGGRVRVTDTGAGGGGKMGGIINRLLRAARSKVEIGWFPAEKYEDGTSVAQVAAIHEYGAPAANIPARPMLGPIADQHRSEYQRIAAENIQRFVIDREDEVEAALEAFGIKVEGDVKKHITDGNFAPLKQATIDRKGSSKPLIDSATMRDTVSHKVTIA